MPPSKRFKKTNANHLTDALSSVREGVRRLGYAHEADMTSGAREQLATARDALRRADAALVACINATGGPLGGHDQREGTSAD